MSTGGESSGISFRGDADGTEAHERYGTLLSAIDDGVYQLDAEGRFVAVNDVIVGITGYASEELLGEHVSVVLDGDGSSLEREIERGRAAPDERGELLELQVRTAEGGRVPCEVRVNVLEGDGTVQGSVGTVREVTDRGRREQRTGFLDGLSQSLRPPTDPDGIVATATRLLAEHLDVDRCVYAEVGGEETYLHVTGDDAPGDAERAGDRLSLSNFGDGTLGLMHANRALVVDDVVADERITGADLDAYDRAGVQSVICVPLHEHGEFTAWMAVQQGTPRNWHPDEVDLLATAAQRCRESLRQARTIRELREREQHLSALIETTPECIKTVAPDGTLLQMNPAGLDMVQADSASDVIGVCVYDLIAPEHRRAFREFNERICRGERGTLEFDIVGLEGGRRHMETHAAPLRSPDGTISHVALTRDVTDQVERERRLEETVRKLERSNERLEQFAYAASHDLQEPLRMVSSYLQLIEQRYADALDEDGEEFIEFAVNGADRMREMVNALLTYSRVETNGDPLEPLELDSVVQDALENLTMRIEERDADVTVGRLPCVRGDAGQLRRVFQNLVSNALMYCEEPPRVHVSAERDDASWVISVRDEGVGIDPEHQERIFEVFQRLQGGEEQPGTGIGLALAERIVERHGGEIWVDSEPDEGATFSFTLPAATGSNP